MLLALLFSGAIIHHLPIKEESDFLAVLDRNMSDALSKPKVLVLNYPSNPSACVADLDFYKEVVQYCKKVDNAVVAEGEVVATSRPINYSDIVKKTL